MVLGLGPVGCGFQPIYARPGGSASSPMAEQLASVRVEAIDDRVGQQLRTSLVQVISPLGEPARPQYLLTVKLSTQQQGLATSKDGNATVGLTKISATYTLSRTGSEGIVYSGQADSSSGYRYLGPRYASTVSEREAESNALGDLASQIRASLAAYFSDPATFSRRRAEASSAVVTPTDTWTTR